MEQQASVSTGTGLARERRSPARLPSEPGIWIDVPLEPLARVAPTARASPTPLLDAYHRTRVRSVREEAGLDPGLVMIGATFAAAIGLGLFGKVLEALLIWLL